MKNKRSYILAGLLVCVIMNSFSQVLTGNVTDTSGNPVAFANVILMNMRDSAFITGTVTDDEGQYLMKCSESADNLIVKASYIGYETFTASYNDLSSGNIIMHDASTQLDEIVIKGSRPTFRMDGGNLTAQIQNTALSNLGDASDVLAQLPFISGNDGSISVFGRGEPVIYINNNRMRSLDELSKLKSDQIKDIKIIMNPGAEYEASVRSVIKINTFRPVGEGLSGMLQGVARQRRDLSHTEAASLNYRTGGLDIFAYGYNKLNRKDQKQNMETQFPFQNESFNIIDNGDIKYKFKSWEAEGGFNYTFSPKHSFGMRYTFDKDENSPFHSYFDMTATKNEDLAFQGTTAQEVWQSGEKQYLNFYYQGQLTDKVLLHFDGDYVNGNKYDDKTTIVNDYMMPDQDDDVRSNSTTNYELYAGKLWLKSSLWKGNLLIGIESSYTNNHQRFNMLSEGMEDDIPSTDNKSEQTAFAPFVSYEKSWGGFTANVGLRYEYVDFRYFLEGIKQEGQSKTYNNLFPTASLSYNMNTFSGSLSYSNTVQRPSYNQLRSSISYNSPFTYEGGNPALLPSDEHTFSFLLSHKNFQLSADYRIIKDNVFFTMKPYEDKSVILFTTINHDVELYNIYLSYSPTISFWNPEFSAGMQGQLLSYEGRTYNKPLYNYSWRNMLRFPKGFMAVLNIEGNSYGDMDLCTVKDAFQLDLSIRKSLLNDRLRLTVGAQDLLNNRRERWSMRINDASISKWNNTDTRSVYVNAVYRFNSAKSKYKGDNASGNEMNRL